jgi:hypothetical protein
VFVGLEQSFVAVLANVIVRAGNDVPTHGLEIGSNLGHAGKAPGAGSLELPAIDDVALIVGRCGICVANQPENALKSRIRIL